MKQRNDGPSSGWNWNWYWQTWFIFSALTSSPYSTSIGEEEPFDIGSSLGLMPSYFLSIKIASSRAGEKERNFAASNRRRALIRIHDCILNRNCVSYYLRSETYMSASERINRERVLFNQIRPLEIRQHAAIYCLLALGQQGRRPSATFAVVANANADAYQEAIANSR